MVSWATENGGAVDWQTSSRAWRWTEALAMARPGGRYRRAAIRSSLARERCQELGCGEGETLVCTKNGHGVVALEGSDGRRVLLERGLAWFVQAESDGATGTIR